MTSKITAAVDTVTRIAAGDDRTQYDGVSIALHWVTVGLVLIQFVLAETWSWFDRPTRGLMVVGHMSFGILLTLAIVLRIAWRLMPGHAVPPASSGWVERASKAVHYLLYVMLAAEAVLGFVLRWSGNESMSFFGLQIPPPFPPLARSAQDLVGALHHWNGWAIVIVAAAHAAAAIFHHVVLRDSVLARMLPPVRAAR
ncbi:MAG: cytochrome [Phenylobacterium sp.]|nr:cytochrome [Phenylobacterium sp.]